MMRGKKQFWSRATVCVKFACPLHVWVSFLWGLHFIPHPKEVHVSELPCLHCHSFSECGRVCIALHRRVLRAGWVPILCSELPEQALTTLDPELKYAVWKNDYLICFISLFKCIHNSHVFQCLILEVLGCLNFDDVMVNRNMP